MNDYLLNLLGDAIEEHHSRRMRKEELKRKSAFLNMKKLDPAADIIQNIGLEVSNQINLVLSFKARMAREKGI